MIDLYILGSGSNGNCTVVKSSKFKYPVMVDYGISHMQEKLLLCGLKPENIAWQVYTHSHGDHYKPNNYLDNMFPEDLTGGSKNFYLGCSPAIHDAKGLNQNIFLSDGNLSFYYRCDSPFYNMKEEGKYLEDADIIFSECNYSAPAHQTDVIDGHPVDHIYPEDLKKRVRETGHMSNEHYVDFMTDIDDLYGLKNKYLIIGHISNTYNSIKTIERDVIPNLPRHKGHFIVDPTYCPYLVHVTRKKVTTRSLINERSNV